MCLYVQAVAKDGRGDAHGGVSVPSAPTWPPTFYTHFLISSDGNASVSVQGELAQDASLQAFVSRRNITLGGQTLGVTRLQACSGGGGLGAVYGTLGGGACQFVQGVPCAVSPNFLQQYVAVAFNSTQPLVFVSTVNNTNLWSGVVPVGSLSYVETADTRFPISLSSTVTSGNLTSTLTIGMVFCDAGAVWTGR